MDITSLENVIVSKVLTLPVQKIQQGFAPFTEAPSDTYQVTGEAVAYGVRNCRIDAVELFSLFTADIIKRKVIFTR